MHATDIEIITNLQIPKYIIHIRTQKIKIKVIKKKTNNKDDMITKHSNLKCRT